MLLQLYTPISASGNPSQLTDILPGGANAIVAGTQPNPWIGVSKIEPLEREVFDNTAAGPATNGQLIGMDPTAVANSIGGGNWILNASAGQKYGTFGCGIVVKPATAVGESCLVRVSGVVAAYVVTDGTHAVAVGTPLVADGSGHLTAVATPTFGQVIAISLGTQAISLGPLLVPVFLASY